VAGTYRYQHGDKPVEGYTVLRGIGRGGFGEVYYAVSDGGREVALKAIQQHHDIELRGVRHCINLKSPNLISIFDVKKNTDGVPFVVMEYVAGPSLRDILSREQNGLGMVKAAYMLREVVKGLSYLHERGIVHRDLKPENIFYEDGFAKIGDYGLSKYISVSRQSGQTISVGTVHYMAPEIGSGNYHQGIDIYALGVIFYELLTGTVPFNGDSMGEILMKHLTQPPDVSALPEVLQPILRKVLAKDPTQRYQTAKELVDEVLAIPEIAAHLGEIEPQSFLSSAPALAGAAPLVPPPLPHNPEKDTFILRDAVTSPVIAAARAAPAAPRAPATPHAPVAPPPLPPPPRYFESLDLRRDNLKDRLIPGLGTALGAALGLSLLTGRLGPEAVFGYFLLFMSVAFSIVSVECWSVPRFRLESGLARRLVTFGLVGPVFAAALLFLGYAFRSLQDLGPSFTGLLASLLVVDWAERTRRERQEQVSVGLAFSAGLFGLVAGGISGHSQHGLLAGFGVLAALSLVVNALSPYTPAAQRKRSRQVFDDTMSRPQAAWSPGRAAPQGAPAVAALASDAAGGAPGGVGSIPPLPGTQPGPRRLQRASSGAMLGGVCAGLAKRFAIDPVWVRVTWVILTIAGLPFTLITYFVLYCVMPQEPAAAANDARAVEKALKVSAGLRRPRFRGTLRKVVGFALAAFCFGSGLYLVRKFGLNDEKALLKWMAFNLGGGLSILMALGRRSAPREGASARSSLSAFTAAGWLFLVWAIVLAAADAFVVGGGANDWFSAGGSVIRLAQLRFRVDQWLEEFLSQGGLFWLGAALFGVAILCFMLGRRAGGLGHVARGGLGWAGLGVCAATLILSLEGGLHGPVPNQQPFAYLPGPEGSPKAFLLGFLLVGSLILLAWPARRRSIAAPTPEALDIAGGSLA